MAANYRVLPNSERVDHDHSFIQVPKSISPLFTGWGPRL